MFESEIAFCLKGMQAFSSKHPDALLSSSFTSPSNDRTLKRKSPTAATATHRRLLTSRFAKCWTKYGLHLEKGFVDVRRVECGECIVRDASGFEDVAETVCFRPFLDGGEGGDLTALLIGAEPGENAVPVAVAAEDVSRKASSSDTMHNPRKTPRALSLRSEFGCAMCDFARLARVDPKLKTTGIVGRIVQVVKRLIGTMEKCANENDDFASLVEDGAGHVRTILDALCVGGWWNLVLEPTLFLTLTYTTHIPLISAQTVPTLTDTAILATNTYLHLQAYTESEQFLTHILQSIDEVATLERLALNNQPLEDTTQQIIDVSVLRCKLALFACKVRACVSGKKIVSVEEVAQRAGAALKELARGAGGPRGSVLVRETSTIYGGGSEDGQSRFASRRASVVAHLRKPGAGAGGGGGTLLYSGIRPDSSLFEEDETMSRRTSVQNLTKIPSLMSIGRSSVAGGNGGGRGGAGGRGFPQPRRMGAARAGLRSLSRQASTMSIGYKLAGLSSLRTSMVESEAESEGLDGIAEGEGGEEVVKVKKKTTKVKVRADEGEEGKMKKQFLFDILHCLQGFTSDRDRFRAVVEGLHALTSADVRLLATGLDVKTQPRVVHTANILLDIGYDIIRSDPETAFAEQRITEVYAKGPKPITPLRPIDLIRLQQDRRLSVLGLEDVIAFSRHQFLHQQYDRYNTVASLLEPFLVGGTHQDALDDTTLQAYLSELQLRLNVRQFRDILHTERKVGFGTDVLAPLGSAANLLLPEISPQVATSVASVIDSVSACAEYDLLSIGAPYLFLDAASLLSQFVSPYIHDLDSNAPIYPSSILSSSTILLALEAIHTIHTIYPHEEPIIGVTTGAKFATLLERMGEFEKAVEVTEGIVGCCGIAIGGLGKAADGVWCITSDPFAHGEVMDAVRKVENESLHSNGAASIQPLQPQSMTSTQLQTLTSLHIDLLALLFRNRLKQRHALATREYTRKEEERYRLTKKRTPTKKVKTVADEDDAKRWCGENFLARGVLWGVVASLGLGIDEEARRLYVKRAEGEIWRGFAEEEALLKSWCSRNADVKSGKPGKAPPPTILSRTPTTIKVLAYPPASISATKIHHHQAYCKQIPLLSTTTHGPTVSISDVEVLGSGTPVLIPPNHDPSQGVEITLSDLTPNMHYIIATAAFDADGKPLGEGGGVGESSLPVTTCFPLPFAPCIAYLGEVAHVTGSAEVAMRCHNWLKSYFVHSVPGTEVLRSVDDGITGEDDSFFSHKLRTETVEAASPGLLRAFAQSIVASVEREFDGDAFVKIDARGRVNVLEGQMLRLKCCRELLVGLDVAKRSGNSEVECSIAVKIAASILSPMLSVDGFQPSSHLIKGGARPSLPYIVFVLTACHSALVRTVMKLRSEEGRRDVILRVFIPLTYQLVRRLTIRRRPTAYHSALRIAEDSLKVVNTALPTTDLRILNSANLEQGWFGSGGGGGGAGKGKKDKEKGTSGTAKVARKGAGTWAAEFSHHALLAVSDDPIRGYQSLHRGVVEEICEFLEVVVATTVASAWGTGVAAGSPLQATSSQFAPPPTPDEKPILPTNIAPPRKSLDTNTTIKELYTVAITAGSDVVLQDLTRFKKHPRYVELVARNVEWTLWGLGAAESAARTCTDVEEWLERRNQGLLRMDEIEEEGGGGGVGGGKRREGGGPRKRKRNMFAERGKKGDGKGKGKAK
ncbi:hypothetical protein HDV00_009731 [Rhizophlyctis rosea]|nr:hypothetical protein HDV00_009731 [Rhizophlyctis rosea]